jgi:N-acetylmuramoyl-L-alanine amidase
MPHSVRILSLLALTVLLCSATPRPGEIGRSKPRLTAASRFTILIDPGHGGEDEGAHASGPPAYCEKELTLATAHYLQSYLHQLGHTVFLTRDRDRTISLQQRSTLANKKAVDLFVSVHYNAAPSVQASGIDVFYYRDGAPNARTRSSESLARYVLNGVIEKTSAISRGVKQGNFAVIRETVMPAILVEGGFLTNQQECKQILDPQHMKKIARGIALGIEHFLADQKVSLLP